MTDKFKKIDREYVLSDSSVNEYGFRLLTSGYQLDAFRKNPIGYYMHRREDGIALKWEDLKIEGDKIMGKPVINLSNNRGEQICNEAENGFLNAASMGHIVVLEYSTQPEMMLPNQTGPTITNWYNKECSLVDIPGNGNALSKLYDMQENEINLADFRVLGNTTEILMKPISNLKLIAEAMNLADTTDEKTLVVAVQNLFTAFADKEQANSVLQDQKLDLQQQLTDLNALKSKMEVVAVLDRALEEKKITIELREQLTVDYADNPTGLKNLVAAMPIYRSIAEQLKNNQTHPTETEWNWDDYEKNDISGKKLKDLRANDPLRYKELFDGKFGL